MKITVLGSGGWGTALALLLLENGNDVTLWSYTEEESKVLRETRENPMLKGVPLPQELKLTTDMGAVKGCGVVVMATPSFAVRTTAAKLRELVDPGTVLVSVSKGIEKADARWWCCPVPPTPRRWGAAFPPVWWRRPTARRTPGWFRICL